MDRSLTVIAPKSFYGIGVCISYTINPFPYRIIENGLIIDEASKTLQYRHLPPWNSGIAKLEILQSSIFKDIMNRNFSAEIYDDNNNLLWKGEIKKQIIDTLL